MSSPAPPKKKRRTYSRNGCKECKRRKLKCDEGKPKCWQCAHLNKECEYVKVVRFNSKNSLTVQNDKGNNGPAKRPVMVEVPKDNNHDEVKQPVFDTSNINNFEFVPEPSTYQYNSLDVDNALFNDASLLINDLNDLIYMNMPYTAPNGSNNSESSLSPTNFSTYSIDDNSEYVKSLTQTLQQDFADTSVAATPVENYTEAFPAINSYPAGSYSAAMSPPPRRPSVSESGSATKMDFDVRLRQALVSYPKSQLPEDSADRWEYLVTLNNSISPKDLVELATYYQWSISSTHVHYMKIFITKIHMNCLPFTTSFLHNSFINCFLLQAKRSPHLLFAMLAMAARYEYYQTTHSDDPDVVAKNKTEAKFHNKIRSYYLSSCLKALDAILDDKQKILKNVESLLLTILILASDYSGSRGSQWRAHLRGAKDLLIKYCQFKPMILDLAIAKIWFYSMESLAGLTVPSGGTIHDFDELGEFLEMGAYGSIGHTLRYYGIAIDGHHVGEFGAFIDNSDRPNTAFNIYLGFNDDVIDILRELILVLESTRWIDENKKDAKARPHRFISERINQDGQVVNTHILHMMQLIYKARLFEIVTNNAPYRIPLTSNCHPHFEGRKNSHVPPSLLLHTTHPKLKDEDDSQNWYSWYDLCQQLYVDASYLRMLVTKNIFSHSIDNPLVQDVVARMITALSTMVKFDRNLTKADYERLESHYNGTMEPTEEPKKTEEEEEESMSEEEPMSPWSKPEEKNEFVDDLSLEEDQNAKLKIVKESALSRNSNISNTKIDLDKYLHYEFDNRMVMIHWPLYVCGLCCMEAKDKAMIECCFNSYMRMGLGSGEITLKKLKRLWRCQKRGIDKTYDVFADDKDSLPFT